MNAAVLRQVLGGAQSPDPAARNAAEEQLKQSFFTDPATHLTLLGNELADETAPSIQTRQLAGLLLKNCMTSKDHAQAVKLANDWMGLDPQARTQIKTCSVQALGSSHKDVRLASAQVISKIATIELPKRDASGRSQWEDLMPTLLQWVVQPEASQAGMAKKEAALNTIGYICEEIADLETDCLQAKSNEILTAVVAGMRAEETDQNVKLAAVKALNNALEFASRNFDVDTERNYILQVICEACTHGSDEVKEYAYQCLSRIAELYYDKLPMYIQAILEMTLSAIQKEADAVARQAITFWSTVCDVEYDMLNSDEGESKCKKFIKGAQKFLVPVLLVAMTTQEEDQDADTFNKSTEAAVCLQSIATTINEEILETVIPWIQTNINQANWRLREAAVMACGCVLEGPSADCLHQFVSALVETLVMYLNDSQQICKDTSAWTLRQVCQHVPTAINKQVIGRLCETIMQAIPASEPSTAEHLCTAVMSLAKFVKEQLLEVSGDNWPSVPNEFSAVVVPLAQCLIATADRPDATEANLRQASYETLNSVIEVADNQIIESFVAPQLLQLLGERLTATFQMQGLNADDANTKSEWQSIFCGTLQVCIGRLPHTFLTVADASGRTIVDKFMELFLQVFSMQNTTSAQDALLAIGSVCNQLPGGGFERYMQHFVPLLVQCISAVGDARLSVLAITITADVARALEGKLAAFSDPIVEALLLVHNNPAVDSEIHQVHDYIKPAIYSCIGDIAMSLGGAMDKYLVYFLQTLQVGVAAAAATRQRLKESSNDDDDLSFYLSEIDEGLLDAYVGIIQGLKSADQKVSGALDAFISPVALDQGCIQLLMGLADYEEKPDAVLKSAVGLIGDMFENFGQKIKGSHLTNPALQAALKKLVEDGKESDDADTQQTADWAFKQGAKLQTG